MKNGELVRFSPLERLVHWLVAASFLLLLLTGLALSYPKLFWLSSLVGGGASARALHPWLGLIFSVGMAILFLLWARDMLFVRGDTRWLAALKHYVLRRREKVPPSGRYNAGQKSLFWAQALLALVFLVSGLPLWFGDGLWGPGLLRLARLVHFVATLLAALLFIPHLYLSTVAFPGTLRAMLFGKVSEAWAVFHHPLWTPDRDRH